MKRTDSILFFCIMMIAFNLGYGYLTFEAGRYFETVLCATMIVSLAALVAWVLITEERAFMKEHVNGLPYVNLQGLFLFPGKSAGSTTPGQLYGESANGNYDVGSADGSDTGAASATTDAGKYRRDCAIESTGVPSLHG